MNDKMYYSDSDDSDSDDENDNIQAYNNRGNR